MLDAYHGNVNPGFGEVVYQVQPTHHLSANVNTEYRAILFTLSLIAGCVLHLVSPTTPCGRLSQADSPESLILRFSRRVAPATIGSANAVRTPTIGNG